MKTILVDAVDVFVNENGRIFQEMYELLERYGNRKIILTNADYEDDNKYGLNDMPYEVFTLKHNPNKPDPIYFTTVLEQFNLTPDDVVYFEHNKDAVESARSVGITSYYYDSETRDLEALKEFLDKEL